MSMSPLEVLPSGQAGNYGYVNRCLWPAPGPGGGIAGAELARRETLERLIDIFTAHYPGCDRRPVVSMWFQIYVAALLPPLFAADHFGGLALPVALDKVTVLFAEDGACTGFVLAPGAPAQGDVFTRFEPVLFDHLAPLIETLAGTARVSRRLLWANAAESLQAIAHVAEHMDGAAPDAAAAADLLLETARWPDGRRNPLAGHTLYRPTDHGHRERARRVCCLRHMLPNFATCPECPAPPEPAR